MIFIHQRLFGTSGKVLVILSKILSSNFVNDEIGFGKGFLKKCLTRLNSRLVGI